LCICRFAPLPLFSNFFEKLKNLLDFQLHPLYNVYQTMKITIIKPKTAITMKTLTYNLLRLWWFLSTLPYVSSVLFVPFFPEKTLPDCLHYYLSITPASGEPENPPKCGLNPFMQNKPNFKPTPSKLNAVLIGTYSDKPLCQPKNNEPNRTQIEPKTNPLQNSQK